MPSRQAGGVRITMAGEQVPRVDVAALEHALRLAVAGEVRFDPGSRALYAADASNYRQVPIGVVVPKSLADVQAAVALARRFGAPVLARGGGTSLAGQACNVAVVVDFSKYLNRVIHIDPARRIARVQPGTILDEVRHAAEVYGLTYGPDPATHNRCTMGGVLANNACGAHAQMAGCAAHNIAGLDVLTYDGLRLRVGRTTPDEVAAIIAEGGRRGAIYAGLRDLVARYGDLIRERYPRIPRMVSGYGLDHLLPEHGFDVAAALIGTEGTCVTFLEAEVKLVDARPARTLVVLGYPDAYVAGDHVAEVLSLDPIGLEGMDARLVSYMEKKSLHAEHLRLLPAGEGWLIVEFGADHVDEALDQARHMMAKLQAGPRPPEMALFESPEEQALVWRIRESGLGATAFVPGERDSWTGWEDSAVPPERLGYYMRELRALMDRHDYHPSFYGHFGQGCIHTRVEFDLTSAEGIAGYRAFTDEAADLVIRYGGSLSGEHGDGQSRGDLLEKMFGPELMQAFRAFKALWDPEGRMNPGKVVDAHPRTADLRLGPDYAPPAVETWFSYPEDEGSFAHATLRCVGVGKCRRLDGGTMCPSFMVTREEQHTTRGRAHALFEMMQGDVLRGGWKDEAVKASLELCLSCKGCKSDCPVNVDMATYKAEFLAHYYEGRLRPRTAYALGLVQYWARIAAWMPGLANLVTQTPLLAGFARRLAGIAPERALPPFADETFQAWFRRHPPRHPQGRRVVLWPDTFTNHFHPEVGRAAVEVLEAAGFRVDVPRAWLCCGRPLYDFGLLDQAVGLLKRSLDVLRDDIRAGVPVVGLEPSCTAVFRDELGSLLPDDADARRLQGQFFTLGELLAKEAPDFAPLLPREVIVQGHCHHKAIMTLDGENEMLKRSQADVEVLDAGCCGMAGSFGFEAGEKYAVSQACGERVLLPVVRAAGPDVLVLADGFSCRTQIAQGAGRRALHLAEALRIGLRGGWAEPEAQPTGRLRPAGRVALGVGAALAVGGLALGLAKLGGRGPKR